MTKKQFIAAMAILGAECFYNGKAKTMYVTINPMWFSKEQLGVKIMKHMTINSTRGGKLMANNKKRKAEFKTCWKQIHKSFHKQHFKVVYAELPI